MRRTIEKGHTLLVDGPACVNLLSGEVEVLGAPLETGIKTVIREGKRVALEAKQKTHFDLTLGENASVEEAEGSTIPTSWENACNTALAFDEKPVVVLVMGEVDSGKTSFCTYLANWALKAKRRVAIVDADLGQSDIGPPATIGFSRITSPTRDLFLLKADEVCFIGTTTPSGALSKVIDELARVKDEGLKKAVDFLVINTDGWVVGDGAVEYKLRLVGRVAPNVVVGIQRQNELTPILAGLEGIRVMSIDSPSAIKKRDREQRKILRELSYKKYLKGAKLQSFPSRLVRIEGFPFGANDASVEKRFARDQLINTEHVSNLDGELSERVKLMREGDERGLLVGLCDEEERFLGIGILRKIDSERRAIQVYTPVTAGIASIHVGRVRLDKHGRETGMSSILGNDHANT